MNGFDLDEEKLLKQLRQAKDIEIEHLLTQYGTSLKDVREMFPQLSGAVRQRQLTTALPTQPIFFTAGEAAGMGLALQEDWMLKFTPAEGNGGYTSSFITPEKWEVTEDDRYISPTGEQYSRADLQALLSMPVGGLTEAPLTPEPLTTANLTEEGQRLYEEYQFGGGKLDVREWMQLMEEERVGTEQVFGKVFPEQDISEIISYIETNTEQFLADLREIGWTEDTEALLRTIIPEITETDLKDIFATTVVPEFVPESWAKDVFWDPFIAGAVGFKQGIETFLFTNPPSPPSEAVPYPVATRTTAIAPEWQFATAQAQYQNALDLTIQGYLRRKADQDVFWASHPELTPKPEYLESPFANPSLFKDPGYIAYTISNSLAYTLAVMGTIVAVSAVATPIAGIPAGLIVAGMPEAGSMLDELVDLGVPIEQAIEPSRLYGLAVGGIETVSDIPFIGLIFKPVGQAVKPIFQTIFRGVANRLARKILTGVLITQIEGVEEALTQVVHNTILKRYDETQSILEGVSHAYIQGVIASLPFGGVGGHASFNTFYDRLSPGMQKRFDGLVVDGIKGGLSKQESQIYATNELAKVPENEAELTQAIEAAQEEYWAEHGPAPAPVIPEMAENILKEIEVMGRVTKKVTPIIPEITTGREYTATVYRGYKVGGAPVDEGLFGKGTYYTTSQEYAETYDGKEVQTVTLKNPFVINNQQEADAFWNETTRPARQKAIEEGKTVEEADELAARAAREWLESRGYDGLIARGIIAPGDEVVVFEPEKVVGVPKAEAVIGEAFKGKAILELEALLEAKYPGTAVQFYGEEGVRITGEAIVEATGKKIAQVKATTATEAATLLDKELAVAIPKAEVTPEVTAPKAVVRYKRTYGEGRSVNFVEYEYAGERYITGTVVRGTDRSLGWYFGKGTEGLKEANRIALLSDEEFSKAEDLAKYSWAKTKEALTAAIPEAVPEVAVKGTREAAFEFARDFYAPYVERGDTIKSILDSWMGFAGPGMGTIRTGGYLQGKKIKRGEISVELPDGSAFVFKLEDIIKSIKERPLIPKAEAISPYKKPPLRHEVPTFGEVGAVPEYKPKAEGRRRVLEARLKRGESVSDELLAEFPDLIEKYKIPTAEPGMPEAGLQPSMLKEVPAKEVRPEARGKLVQSRLGDYLQLREYNAKAVTDRISVIKKALETPGRLPKELGLRGNLHLELARLEAQQELDAIETVDELDHLIKQVGEELGLRSMPYAGYGGKSHIDLIRSPTHRLFKEYTSKQLDEIMKVYRQARQTLSPEVPATPLIKAEDIPTDIPALTNVALTPKQIQKTLDLFKEAVAAPNTEIQRAAAIELRKHVLAQRAALAKESAETMIAEGMNPEEAIKLAEQQFMTGQLPDVTSDYFSDLTQEMRNVLFAKVYNYWKDKSWFELISTFEALTNTLAGKSIPRIKGIGTKYFPDGGSAWDRLARVFIGDMEMLEALDQGKSLRDIIEGVFLETGRGSVPLNQETVNWLKELSTISAEDRLLLEKPLSEITEADVHRIAQGWFYQRRQELQTLLEDGVITQEEYKLQLAIAKDKAFPYKPIEPVTAYPSQIFGEPRLGEIYTPLDKLAEARTQEEIRLATFELQRKYRAATEEGSVVSPPSTWAEYNKAFEEPPLLTFREKGTIIRTLKSIGMTVIDIGNLLRANKASFDFSFWRQARALAAGHPVAFYRANIEAWKALWSQASAEANWQWITRDPDFQLYEEIKVRTGADPLRIFEAPKGTAQWQAAEEFGYLTGERAIPRFTARIPWIKVSGRSFVAGTNTMSWLVWKKCLEATRARAMRIASGDIKLAEGEALSIYEEMADYQKYIADAIQRASLGKAAPLAPVLSSMFFAPRSKLARLLYPRHLISSNPRVRALAWKDFSLFIGTMSGLVMMGYWLGLWDVERDPRNAEFMSIRIGNMRIDPWAGNRQFVVLYARLITGTGLSSVTGQEYEVNPIAALTTFFRSSLSPLASILLNFWTGKNFLGEEVDIANPKQWLEQIAPFAIQDIMEAFQDDWQNGLIAILPAIVGEGVQTYTGDWKENWAKLGLPKYPENTGYGIYEPVYDLADFWADTASQLRGVDPATLTESKGYPESVRSIAQALQIIETIETLPNKRLASLNADPEEGTTFIQYYKMWQERQMIVASGDEDKLQDFDADERTRSAYLGNMTQAQYALLMQYHSLPESQKAEFLGNHPEIYINPREDWLRSHPEENALLALWDKSKAYSLAALDKVTTLARSLGIPESAMIARDLDAVAQLKIKHENLFDLLDVYGGLDDEIKDAEGLTARDRAVQELYTNNPDLRDDMRRIEALSEGTKEMPTLDDIVEAWVDRGRIADEFGASSAEAKLWLLDNREAHQWALDCALLTDDGTDWNEPVLRLLVQYREDFDKYGDYGDISSDSYILDDEQRAEARDRLLFDAQDNLTAFGKAYYTREASSQGYSEGNWNAFVEYAGLPIWGSWRERFLLDNADFYKEYTDPEVGNHPLVDKTRVRPVNRDKIYQQFYDEFQSWDETGGMAPKAIENMRAELDAIERGGLTFQEARYSVQAYDNGFPENLIDAYVEWYSTDRKDYEDDWWLMEHKEFYLAMYDLDIWTEYRDFSKVPTREVYNLYKTYLGLPTGTPRYDFRAKHLDLDDWLVLKFGYKPIEDRGSAGAEPTPWEELQEAERFKETFK